MTNNKNFSNSTCKQKVAASINYPTFLVLTVLVIFAIIAPLLSLSATTIPVNQMAYAQTAGTSNDTATEQAGGTTNVSSTFLRYSNPGFGINLEYPSSWTALEIWRASQVVPSSDYSGSIVSFLPPSNNVTSNNASGFRDNVLIGRQDANDRTIDEYTSQSLEAYRANVTDLRISESTPTTLGGNPAHRIIYTENVEGDTVQKMQIWSIVGNYVYLITFGADQSEYPHYLPDVERMISTLQINPLQQPVAKPQWNSEETFSQA